MRTLLLLLAAAALFGVSSAAAQPLVQIHTSSDPMLGLGAFEFEGGKTLDLSLGIGSGAYRHPDDPPMLLWTVSDGGPNLHCGEIQEVTGVPAEVICTEVPEGMRGRIYLLHDYAPAIHAVVLEDDGTFALADVIALKDAAGKLVSGLPNPLSGSTKDFPLSRRGEPLDYDPAAVDPEALVKLSDGTFWLAEEQGPSLFHADAQGRIQTRLVPAGIEGDFAGADYATLGLLPAILAKRHLNRGIESLAISPDERFLYFILQSPLDNPDADAYRSSRNVRLFKLDRLTLRPVAEYVYQQDPFDTFRADDGKRQDNVRISEARALGDDRLLVLERIGKTTKLYEVELGGATDILGTAWDDPATSPTLEQQASLEEAVVVPVRKTLRFDSADVQGLPGKIEAMAFLGDGSLALINDNDFGIAGAETVVIRISGLGLTRD